MCFHLSELINKLSASADLCDFCSFGHTHVKPRLLPDLPLDPHYFGTADDDALVRVGNPKK